MDTGKDLDHGLQIIETQRFVIVAVVAVAAVAVAAIVAVVAVAAVDIICVIVLIVSAAFIAVIIAAMLWSSQPTTIKKELLLLFAIIAVDGCSSFPS